VRSELLGDALPGARLSLRVKLTPKGLLAESHPGRGHFTIEVAP
jgi:hypothetical protein